MKKNLVRYIQVVLGILLAHASLSIEAASLYVVEIEAKQLNVREYPTTQSEVIGSFTAGDTTIASKSDTKDWYFINYKEKSGYISSNFVKLLRVIVTEDTINDAV